MIGPSRKLQRGPPAFWARSRANVRRSRHAGEELVLLGDEVGLRGDGSEHRASGWGTRGRAGTGRTGAPAVRVSYPRCSHRRSARPRARSPFAAAFLSLIFPGSRPAYAGAYQRALAFAALPILLLALGAGFVLRERIRVDLVGLVLTPWVLPSVFVLNILALLYRLVATIDAYRVDGLPERGRRRRAAGGSAGRS